MTGVGYDTVDGGKLLQVAIEQRDLMLLGRGVIEKAATMLAEAWVKEHGAEVLAAITPEAVATMTMAQAAAGVKQILDQKLPDKVIEVERTRTEVYERGLFGGVRRVR